MRFGVVGPARGNLLLLEKGISLLLGEHRAESVVYLGPDGDTIDTLVLGWAERLVGERPTDDGLWDRAARCCATGTAQQIDAFLGREKEREQLRALRRLPAPTSRTVELLDGKVAVLLHDMALLDEEDIQSASWLIFGKNPEPLLRQIGSRTFISPGELAAGRGGLAFFSTDPSGDVSLDIYEPGGRSVASHTLSTARTGKFTALGSMPTSGRT